MTVESISETYTVNNEGFVFTEVAAGGTNFRGTVQRRYEVQPHGANHFTSLHDHAADFVEYVNDPNTGKGVGSCRGYAGAVKPRFVPIDIDRENLQDALTDNRKLTRRLVEQYGVLKDAIRIYFSGSKGFHDELPA